MDLINSVFTEAERVREKLDFRESQGVTCSYIVSYFRILCFWHFSPAETTATTFSPQDSPYIFNTCLSVVRWAFHHLVPWLTLYVCVCVGVCGGGHH